MYLAGRRGRVPLVVSWKLFPVPVAMFRLEWVWGRGVVPLTMRVILRLMGRGEEFPVFPMGFTVCLMGRGGESIVSFLPIVVMGDSAM